MNLRLCSEDSAEICRIRAEGDIRAVEEPRDPREIEELLGPQCYRRPILLDLQDAAHIDSSGVSWLIKCHKLCQSEGGKLVLHSIPPSVVGILKMLRLEQVLNMAEDETAASLLAQGEPA